MGTMRFAAGSHREGYLGDMPISDDSEAHLEEFLRIPTKPATHSNRKPATDSDLKPAGVPI